MLVTETRDPDLHKILSDKNLKRQYDLLHDFIEIGVRHGPQAFDNAPPGQDTTLADPSLRRGRGE